MEYTHRPVLLDGGMGYATYESLVKNGARGFICFFGGFCRAENETKLCIVYAERVTVKFLFAVLFNVFCPVFVIVVIVHIS